MPVQFIVTAQHRIADPGSLGIAVTILSKQVKCAVKQHLGKHYPNHLSYHLRAPLISPLPLLLPLHQHQQSPLKTLYPLLIAISLPIPICSG